MNRLEKTSQNKNKWFQGKSLCDHNQDTEFEEIAERFLFGGCETQAKAHAVANLSVGNTRIMLIDAITQCLPFIGFTRALNAISCIGQE